MSIRKEALGALYNQIDTGRIIPIRRGETRSARAELEEARKRYEDARRKVIYLQLPRYYRVAIFGSARLKEDSPEFKFVSNLSQGLVEARQVDIVTGGGPSLMKAAHLGQRKAIEEARQNGSAPVSKSIGIVVPGLDKEDDVSEHLDIRKNHFEFSTRLQDFVDLTHSAYNAPGGLGTLLETLIVLQLKQVGHLEKDYLVMAHPFWRPVVDAWNDELYHKREDRGQVPLISSGDLEIIRFSDQVPEIVDLVSASYDKWKRRLNDHVRVFPPADEN